ncbi:head maturation protease, ClpP-related [Aurantimonas sp. 22II-16-19i]|uniref:head maturation protease, ClpP-related n=1 Tax=Aurantimonas sp. 22II-16-19i TaxID=1317114 RepID=UPI0009F7A5A0|nr:head maturation protease, ClpP-related [Aurantimonas sp. 22II-16-19i]ORE90992.1 peptidase S14, ClpP [Aurantimonas sp. 22II-16-19i]
MAAILEDGKLRLSGYVGDYYFEDGFTSSDVVTALAQVEDDSTLTVHLNSAGGIATEGAAIHALLSARSGTTDIVVEGIAASAASLIAMAGETVTMAAGAVMMIHDPSGYTFGTSDDHRKTVEGLEALATAYARVYAAKSGKTADECRTIMREERWLTPEEAVAQGFADETTEIKAAPVAAFDYRIFAHAPKRLVALAKKKDWRLDGADTRAAASAAPRQTQESSMTDKERADALAAELDTLKAQMSASKDADKTATMAAELAELKAEKSKRETSDAIMALDEAQGREAQAKALADAGVTAEAAKAVLAAGKPVATANGGPTPEDYAKARMSGGVPQPGGAQSEQKKTSLLKMAEARYGGAK